MFFATVQRPSYVGTDGGLLAASGAMDMQEVAQQQADYVKDMEAFAAGSGSFAVPARGGSPRPVGTSSSGSLDQHQHTEPNEDISLHNPLPI